LPLIKHFFFPGFASGTGGLLRESGLLDRRAAFQADARAMAAFWSRLGLPQRRQDELRLSLFSYANVATLDLLSAWQRSHQPVSCLVPEGTAVAALAGAELGFSAEAGAHFQIGSLSLFILPFLEQDDYDQLLWACDLNFVRGEDSFVRAQWAARPFVWHIYPQQEDAHHAKLNSFLDLYCAALEPGTAGAVRRLWHDWNGVSAPIDIAAGWKGFMECLPALRRHCPAWAGQLAKMGDLAGNLEIFVTTRL
jgi:uncharacterized repeat protein (TIGR03837 family)